MWNEICSVEYIVGTIFFLFLMTFVYCFFFRFCYNLFFGSIVDMYFFFFGFFDVTLSWKT
jgi:hypothetical protein